jgi:hypothetical protein
MDGPLAIKLPPNATPLDYFLETGDGLDVAHLPTYTEMALAVGPKREERIQAEASAFEDERLLSQTRGTITALLEGLNLQLGKLWISSWDELIDNPDACDSLALSERLQPLEYQITFLTDTKNRLEVRIRAARLMRLEATLERRKIESLDAQLLAAISRLRTLNAMQAVREEEGSAMVIGKRTETLRQAAREAARQVSLAEDALRQERNAQLSAEQARMATGTVSRAEAASAVPEYQG